MKMENVMILMIIVVVNVKICKFVKNWKMKVVRLNMKLIDWNVVIFHPITVHDN